MIRSVLFATAALVAAAPAVAAPKLQSWVTTGDKSQLLAAQTPSGAVAASAVAGLPVIAVDAKERHQTMVGFGGAITDASAWLIQNKLNPAQRDRLLKELYGRGESGLGFSFTRITIGASDFSLDHYSLDDAPGGAGDPKLEHFSLKRPQEFVFPTVRAALKINPELKVMASPWSAPAWMKTNGSLVQGQLKAEAYPVYADFFARYIQEAKKVGVPTDYLSIQNEPDFEPDSYPGMRWNAKDRAKFFGENLAPAFKRAKITTKVLDWDHNWDQPQQPTTVLADPKARAFMAGVAWHCYAGDVSAQQPVTDANPDKEVFLTECSGGEWAPKFDDSFAWMVENLIIGSVRGGSRGVLMWNLALDEQFGPHAGGCKDCRPFVTIDSQTGAITRTQEYYAFGHASRFVKPGATRIGSPAKVGDLRSVAFQNKDGGRVLIVLNVGTKPADFVIAEGKQTFKATLPARAAGTFTW
ncbi:glycoside hydrolase family 30 beta sandwich domain-containing protein [Caulobacter sp.]|uniref:glycoside hydrolase family 30 protein n=1 Tax=Caulobacter sp. TaxID=78 RepID=UPI0025C2F72D|nr:glycoside hydrolase family 30 beta sandwich domain-containing protein [Caulobacter sp.]